MAVVIKWPGGRISMRDEDVSLRIDVKYDSDHDGWTDALGHLTIYHAGSSMIVDLLDLAASSTPFDIVAKRGRLTCRITAGHVSQTGRDRRCEFNLTAGGALPEREAAPGRRGRPPANQ